VNEEYFVLSLKSIDLMLRSHPLSIGPSYVVFTSMG
jgi:hypothetical protein